MGGILVFLTGRKEILDLSAKLKYELKRENNEDDSDEKSEKAESEAVIKEAVILPLYSMLPIE